MENNIKRTCIDFIGIPGSGKSTIAHSLFKALNSKYYVCEPSYHIDHEMPQIQRWFSKFFLLLKFAYRYPNIFFIIIKYITRSSCFPYKIAFYTNLLNISYKLLFLKESNTSYIIFDQGLWQSVNSLYYPKIIDNDRLVNDFNFLLSLVGSFNYITVLVNVDRQTAIERLKNRSTNISRIQRLDIEKRNTILDGQIKLFEKIKADVVIDSHIYNVTDSTKFIMDSLQIV